MKYKCLDKLELPVIGQGGTGIIDENVIRCGVRYGSNYIDTAEIYGTEVKIGRAIYGVHNIVSTKFSPENSSYDNVINSAKQSSARLLVPFIDLYLLHWPFPDVPIKETVEAMEYLVDAGIVNHIGFCNMSLREIKEAMQYLKHTKISAIQAEYNLFDRSAENLFDFCKENKILFIAYSPLDKGRICNKKQAEVINAMSMKYNRTPAQIVLNWITRDECVVAIPKTTSTRNVIDNAMSVEFEMSKEDIDSISAFKNEVVYVKPSEIKPAEKMYQTVEEATQNPLNMQPSPLSLSKVISDDMKPIRINEQNVLLEGMVRYWAWVIAKSDTPIPTLIRRWEDYGN